MVAPEIEAIDLGEHVLRGRGTSLRLFGVVGWKGQDRQVYDQIQADYRQAQAELKQSFSSPS